MDLNKEEKRTLVNLAKRAVTREFDGKNLPQLVVESETLCEKRGAFVTLKKRGALRGCIGYIKAEKPLWQTVQEMAVAAAFQDPRFPPLRAQELKDLSFEISVLSPLRRVKDVTEIEVGKHGLFVVRGYNSGLLLPQVAVEYGWDKETFLNETCRKAGLPLQAWRDRETEIYIFSADYFDDIDLT